MRVYGVEGRRDGLANGLRALGALGAELASSRAAGGERLCPICGWSGRRFSPEYFYDAFEPEARCWVCGSAARCRLFEVYIERRLADFFGASRRRVLDIGPVTYSRVLLPEDVDYTSFDLHGPLAEIRGDLSRTPFPNGSFDFWICSHVLDVIPDDTAAMRELLRLLSPQGVGLLDNAMNWDQPTRQYASPRRGDCNRLRRYGSDLVDRLRGVGFAVEVVDPRAVFDAETRLRGGLRDTPFLLCRPR
jgi:SAM-dependent methyltransferase